MKILLIIFILLEIVAFIVAFREAYRGLKKYVDRMLTRCVEDISYRNKIASRIFFFQDMGPSISSFSIISFFITSSEKTTTLIVVFIIGYNMKELSRRFKNAFYKKIEERS